MLGRKRETSMMEKLMDGNGTASRISNVGWPVRSTMTRVVWLVGRLHTRKRAKTHRISIWRVLCLGSLSIAQSNEAIEHS